MSGAKLIVVTDAAAEDLVRIRVASAGRARIAGAAAHVPVGCRD
jgi:hypothetical protein